MAALACAPALGVGCNSLLGNDRRSLDTADASAEASADATTEAGDAGNGDAGSLDAGDAAAAADASDACTAEVGTDDKNCGACGHSCLGGACEAGVCGPSLVADGEGTPNALYVDPGATGNIVWCDYASGAVVSVDKVTGARTTINPAFSGRFAADLAVGPQVVFWSSPSITDPDASAVFWANRDGTQPGFVSAHNWYTPIPIVTDGTYAYWGNRYDRDIWRLDVATKTPRAIGGYADGSATQLLFIGLDPLNGYVFYSDGTNVLRMNNDGANVVQFSPANATPSVGPFLVDGGYLYWFSGPLGSVVRELTTSGCAVSQCPQIVLKGDKLSAVNRMAADETYLYLADNGGHQLLRTRKDGSTVANADVLAKIPSDQGLSGVAVDSVAVYYALQYGGANSTGFIWRIAK